jgi:hypothetical protein
VPQFVFTAQIVFHIQWCANMLSNVHIMLQLWRICFDISTWFSSATFEAFLKTSFKTSGQARTYNTTSEWIGPPTLTFWDTRQTIKSFACVYNKPPPPPKKKTSRKIAIRNIWYMCFSPHLPCSQHFAAISIELHSRYMPKPT